MGRMHAVFLGGGDVLGCKLGELARMRSFPLYLSLNVHEGYSKR